MEIKVNGKENEFLVVIKDKKFSVHLDNDYYQQLTEGKVSKEELIVASFKFLLDREPIEQILSKFNLQIIEKYFSEYEKKIKEYF